MLISVAFRVREHILLLFNVSMTYGLIKALWCLSTTRLATRYLKTMLKILVDRAVMHHISFLSEWYLLWCLINSHVVFHVTITFVNNLFPDFCSICNFFGKNRYMYLDEQNEKKNWLASYRASVTAKQIRI